LFCVREDPNGGGQTIISNFHEAIHSLTTKEIEILKLEIFEEGSFFELNNVGTELNHFPILKTLFNGEKIIRFTSRMNSHNRFDSMIRKIEELLIKNQKTFLLKRNQMVICNQRAVCHGRLELTGNQKKINPNYRRLILQTFGKNHELSY
jgi:hypothetical protein